MPKDYIEKVGEEEFRKKPIGSGPWNFVRSVPGDRIEFEAVDYPHWRGTPHFKELQILLVPEESTRVSMVRTGEAAIASIGPERCCSARARRAAKCCRCPARCRRSTSSGAPTGRNSRTARSPTRGCGEALSLAIDRKQIIEHVMNGKASMPYPFAAFGYTEYFNADKWKKWADKAYRYDPAAAKQLLAEAGYPNGFELNFANTALPGTQFMVDVGTAVADMWTKAGVKVNIKNYEWGSFAPLARGDQAHFAGTAPRCTAPSAGPTCRGATRRSSRSTSEQHLLGDKDNCDAACQEFEKIYAALLAERDAGEAHRADRPHGRAGGQYLDRRADHRRHGLLRDQSRSRSASSPRSPGATSSATCSSASRGPTKSPGRNSARSGADSGSVAGPLMKRYIVYRLLQGVVLLCLVATIVFFLGRLTGNPVDLMLPEDATAGRPAGDDQGARARRLAARSNS